MGKRGRKPTHDLTGINCPNPQCPGHQKPDAGGIVANGSYRTRAGVARRYLCRACGRSFCSTTGSPFYELRSPAPRLISALKLLIKGVSIRQTADILTVTPVTIRAWLRLALRHQGQINQIILAEPGITQPQLDELWRWLSEGELRRRAILARQRTGWRRKPLGKLSST